MNKENHNLLAKYAIALYALTVNVTWLNDELQDTNVCFAPELKQACKKLNREAKEVLKKWYETHVQSENTQLLFNDILDAWENLIKQLRFNEPEQIRVVIEALKSLNEPANKDTVMVSKEDLPQGYAVLQNSQGKWFLVKLQDNNFGVPLIACAHIQNIATEKECYEKAFNYLYEIGVFKKETTND